MIIESVIELDSDHPAEYIQGHMYDIMVVIECYPGETHFNSVYWEDDHGNRVELEEEDLPEWAVEKAMEDAYETACNIESSRIEDAYWSKVNSQIDEARGNWLTLSVTTA